MGLIISGKCDGCWERIENCDCGNYRNSTITKQGIREENMSHITRGRPREYDDYCPTCHQIYYDCHCRDVSDAAERKKKVKKKSPTSKRKSRGPVWKRKK